jgi:hypothetical protein
MSRHPRNPTPERTCFRCDGIFRVACADRRVYCPACRATYGFPPPAVAWSREVRSA